MLHNIMEMISSSRQN